MAQKPTIYKLKIALSDLNRDYYDDLNLTIAQHPSETLERLMVRVLAYCMNAQENLVFTKGLNSPEQPDIWAQTLDGKISLWIDVGEPNFDRIKKARQLSSTVKVYSFNSKSGVWWKKGSKSFQELEVSVFQFPWEKMQELAELTQRSMDLSITITEDSLFITTESGESAVICTALQTV